ncbi:MAG: thermonuclease family protein [Thermodesulfobacteriota bacterium]
MPKFPLRVLAILIILAIWPAVGVWAADFVATVIAVMDGDTVTVLDEDKRQHKVRLAEIDTPESGQPYGHRAKEILAGLVHGRRVEVAERDTDRYGRLIARLAVDGVDVNAEMVRQGAAWVYRRYATDQTLYGLEEQARRDKVGLWGLPEAERQPPWEWRRQGRKRGAVSQREEQPASPTLLEQVYRWGKRLLGQE